MTGRLTKRISIRRCYLPECVSLGVYAVHWVRYPTSGTRDVICKAHWAAWREKPEIRAVIERVEAI